MELYKRLYRGGLNYKNPWNIYLLKIKIMGVNSITKNFIKPKGGKLVMPED